MKRRPPTYAEAERIALIVSEIEVTFKGESFDWKEHKAEAYAILDSMGIDFSKRSCFACWVGTLNKLRKAINLDPIDHGARPERAAFRMDVCTTCPAYHASRGLIPASCGRFVLDALAPEPVMIEGEEVKPCGCALELKVNMKHATCPASRWT